MLWPAAFQEFEVQRTHATTSNNKRLGMVFFMLQGPLQAVNRRSNQKPYRIAPVLTRQFCTAARPGGAEDSATVSAGSTGVESSGDTFHSLPDGDWVAARPAEGWHAPLHPRRLAG